eukprot:TRINITY_DN10448_c0_g1_i2.p1 TRINITY_DN10448_c0_g1~~TRINITY_DN10448_c0_g1_i2.p1  ORF type:complete len:145 (+),score=1.07 TRINITY_DN10448_c0_g1_i2:23-457(+)
MRKIPLRLDVSTERFAANVKMLKERSGYYGCVNLLTGETKDFTLSNYFPFAKKRKFLPQFFKLAEKILVLKPEDEKDPAKTLSHTATVTYHAMKNNLGLQRTFVSWEPTQPDGTKGVEVTESHQWMYFFNPTSVELLKEELNRE